MKDLKNTILEDLPPKITWDDFIKACWSYFNIKNDHINMYEFCFRLNHRECDDAFESLVNLAIAA